ncbi:hypothetical protein [Nonomuraea dietziae]|uniref:hypothetical protein n=1 Tax=Nonomuraea dietziae TaxID=65515 RepID=UPI0031D500F2
MPYLENSTRRMGWISVMVPTVERAPPPTRFWSMTTAGVRWASRSASGRSNLGSLFLMKAL